MIQILKNNVDRVLCNKKNAIIPSLTHVGIYKCHNPLKTMGLWHLMPHT